MHFTRNNNVNTLFSSPEIPGFGLIIPGLKTVRYPGIAIPIQNILHFQHYVYIAEILKSADVHYFCIVKFQIFQDIGICTSSEWVSEWAVS